MNIMASAVCHKLQSFHRRSEIEVTQIIIHIISYQPGQWENQQQVIIVTTKWLVDAFIQACDKKQQFEKIYWRANKSHKTELMA